MPWDKYRDCTCPSARRDGTAAPLSAIPVIGESPTTFRMMFNAPFPHDVQRAVDIRIYEFPDGGLEEAALPPFPEVPVLYFLQLIYDSCPQFIYYLQKYFRFNSRRYSLYFLIFSSLAKSNGSMLSWIRYFSL